MTAITPEKKNFMWQMLMVSLVFWALSLKLPPWGLLLLPLSALPLFLILLSCGVGRFLFVSALAVAFVAWLTDYAIAFNLVPFLLVPVFSLFYAIVHKFEAIKAIAFATALSTLLLAPIWYLMSPPPDAAELQKALFAPAKQSDMQPASIEKVLEQFEQADLSDENIQAIKNNIYQTLEFFSYLLPLTVPFVRCLFIIVVFYLGAIRYSSMLEYEITRLPKFSQLRLNWNFIWLFICGWFFYYILGHSALIGNTILTMAGANLIAISKIIYYIAGLSLMVFAFEKYKFSKLSRLGLSVFAVFFAQAVVWIGIIDVWLDFRTQRPRLLSSDNSNDEY